VLRRQRRAESSSARFQEALRRSEAEAAQAATAHTEASTQWREERGVLQDAVYQAQQQVSQGLWELSTFAASTLEE
jgi:hypothetical protein